jgi:hypothetical protein
VPLELNDKGQRSILLRFSMNTYYHFPTVRIGVRVKKSAEKEVIRQAKKLAAENGTTVSALFSNIFRAMGRTSGLQEPSARSPGKRGGSSVCLQAPMTSAFSKTL